MKHAMGCFPLCGALMVKLARALLIHEDGICPELPLEGCEEPLKELPEVGVEAWARRP